MHIVDINTAARVWMVLPGKKASIFRSNLADLFIRVIGGDASLAEEIKQIGEFQDTLPENHPLRTPRAPNVPTLQSHAEELQAAFAEFQEKMQNQRIKDREDLMQIIHSNHQKELNEKTRECQRLRDENTALRARFAVRRDISAVESEQQEKIEKFLNKATVESLNGRIRVDELYDAYLADLGGMVSLAPKRKTFTRYVNMWARKKNLESRTFSDTILSMFGTIYMKKPGFVGISLIK